MQENFGVEVICTPNIHKQQSLPIIPTSHLHSGPSWNASSGRKMPWKLWREPPNCSTALEMMQLDDGRKHERRLGWARQMNVKILVETSNDRRSYRKFSFVPFLCCQILDHTWFTFTYHANSRGFGICNTRNFATCESSHVSMPPDVISAPSLPKYRIQLVSMEWFKGQFTGFLKGFLSIFP
jgi:hypothetical protein